MSLDTQNLFPEIQPALAVPLPSEAPLAFPDMDITSEPDLADSLQPVADVTELAFLPGVVEPHTDEPITSDAAIYDIGEYLGPEAERNCSLSIVAVGRTELNPALYLDARRLRARVYITEKGFLPVEAFMEDGGEMDEDDDRSYHFAAAERSGGDPIVAGTARLIVKRSLQDQLPAERLFTIDEAKVGSTESSRYIARHPDRRLKNAASMALIRSMTFQSVATDAPHLYAVLEEPLYRMFGGIGIPFEKISDTQFVEEYNTKNFVVKCDPRDIVPSVRAKDARERTPETALAPFFDKAEPTRGLGWFTKGF